MDAHKNFAYSTVATAPSPATSGTSLVVASGDGAKFPAAPFNATVWATGVNALSTNAEIVRVTAISTDTLTITRAQESSTARTVVVGDQIAATITKKTLTDAENSVSTDSIFDAAGDLVIGTGADASARLAVATAAGKAPCSDPNDTNKLSWQYPLSIEASTRGTTGSLVASWDRSTVAPTAVGYLSTGRLSLARMFLPKGLPVATITFVSGSTAMSVGTNQWFALFDSSRNVLAKTADDTSTAWAANTVKTLTVTGGPYVTTTAGWYYIGIMVKATTVPTMWCAPATSGAFSSLAPIPVGTADSSLTDPASCPATTAALTATTQVPYMEVS